MLYRIVMYSGPEYRERLPYLTYSNFAGEWGVGKVTLHDLY